jgi:GWxTD domain-containing protein
VKEGFESSFEVTVSLLSKDSNKLSKTTFSDSINVKNFSETVKMSKPRIIVNKFLIPYGEFDINFSLKDLDTKLVGKKQTKVPRKNLPSNRYIKIFEPIFVIHKDGDWNFGLDRYPLNLNKIASKDGFIEFYQYIYFEEKGEYLINISLVSEDGKWEKSFIEKVTSNNIEKLIKAPLKGIETSNLKIKVDISKDNNVISKSFPIKLKNSEKENFFKKVWAKRDPDLTTKENELMEEYYRRVNFSEENFSRGSSQGWRSDMGMIYILFGKPDDIVKSMNPQQSYNFETWYYFQINEEFVFIDEYGFGNFRLRTQFLN